MVLVVGILSHPAHGPGEAWSEALVLGGVDMRLGWLEVNELCPT